MAQVCGGSSFDYVSERQHEIAPGLLRKAADSWSSSGAEALSRDALIAVLLRVYLSTWPEFAGLIGETRDLQSWLQLVAPAGRELSSLRPGADPGVLGALDLELSVAVNQWALGDPESPPTTHTINAIEHVMFSTKLTRRPADPKMPTSLLHDGSTSSLS